MVDFAQPNLAQGPIVQSGAPDYQKAATELYAAQRKPYYQKALEQLRQGYAGRGMLESGLAGQGELGMQQEYLQDVGQQAQKGALAGADVAEQRRAAQQQFEWQTQLRNLDWQHLQEQMRQQEETANQQQFSQLLGGLGQTAGTVIGGIYGGPMGAAAGGAVGGAAGKGVSQLGS